MANSRIRSFQRIAALAAAGALALVACGSDESSESVDDSTAVTANSTDGGGTADGETLDIAYIQTGSFDYYERGMDGATMAADPLNIAIVPFNSNLEAEKELANVEDAITTGVDGIVLFSVGRAAQEAAIATASAAGVPIAFLYGWAPELEQDGVAFVQADTAESGSIVGEWLAGELDSGEVAIIQGALGRGDAESYTESFKEGLSTNADLEVVAEPAADWDRAQAVAAMEDILTTNPDLAAVFVQNEDMALGAIQAIETAGKSDQIIVVSQNGSPDGIAAVESGQIAATAAWSPSLEAQLVLSRLVEGIRSGTPPEPRFCPTPIKLITADNVADADPWVPTDASTANALTADCG